LQTVAREVRAHGTSDESMRELRASLGLSLTLCNDDDVIGAIPALEDEGFNLYYVDGSGHCWSLTSDPARATGLLVAATQ
jgi:hypothetical protein